TPAVKAPPLKPATPSVAKRPATPPPVAPKPATPAPRPTPAPAAAASDMRPPMIKGTPTKRPALPGLAGGMVAAAASADSAPRSATLMGMPSLKMPPGKKDIPGVTNVSSAAVAQAAVAAVPAAAAEAAQQAGLDPNGPEMQALVKLSTDVIERVVWEVVPDLAETIIRENLDKLTAQRS
ncbi:MAG: hypothetical protein KJO07_11670, partial [Deltaproteobacteria bacterium]|nr:hypothetical protein [Deltaproteobacteria bacterium]